MPGSVGTALAGVRWLARRWPAYRAFRRALARPAAAQAQRLRAILARNAGSAYGRAHGFATVRDLADYQARVPVVTHETLAPWIDAALDGRPGVLTVEPLVAVERTGGSSGGAKAIPYTASGLAELRGAIAAWMVDLALRVPGLWRGGAYWSVTPPARPRETTRGGVPVGFADDTEYFAPPERARLRRTLVTPPELGGVPDVAGSRYVTLRFLLAAPHLTFVSVWHPSTLTLLMEALDGWAERLLDDLARGTLSPPGPLPLDLQAALARHCRPAPRRARRLRARLAALGRLDAADLWPRLRLLSCWADAGAARALPALRARFPGVPVQPKGLLATEGVVSVPLVGHPGGAVAVTAHVYEFRDLEAPDRRPRWTHELEVGGRYEVLLTTGGGLYRYALGDLVRVVGRVGATPLVEFVGRSAQVSDLCGEKLDEAHAAHVLGEAAGHVGLAPTFLMLAPEEGPPPGYVLLVEAARAAPAALAALAARVEGGLWASPSYRDCRVLGQLGPVRAVAIGPGAEARYLERCVRLGQRLGDVKAVALHRATGWEAHLGGTPAHADAGTAA